MTYNISGGAGTQIDYLSFMLFLKQKLKIERSKK